jgi:hypothetical protein
MLVVTADVAAGCPDRLTEVGQATPAIALAGVTFNRRLAVLTDLDTMQGIATTRILVCGAGRRSEVGNTA